ncbi:DgyrCDS4322 [Dimorphilus gyrociliatus]|uniref:DgyrCDS4322 n=1 Tax=Dimorphilus gyrociliatus TaxID=2664684 RepID=A0A7I8VI51_9ANNE|nr:DgyrCDS4322 [Dimorphilus gyrociliatus]
MGNKTSTLKPEIINDLEQQTQFTREEIGDLYRQFLHDCKDKSKMHMTVDEFKKMYSEIFPNGDAEKFAEHVFRTFDQSGKGHINFRQFMLTLNIQLKGSLKQKLLWLFDMYDIHRTQYITKDEVKQMITSLTNLRANVLHGIGEGNVDDLVEYIFERASSSDKIRRENFIQTAIESRTIQMILEGAAKAANNPYAVRRDRSGSIGRPSRSRSGSLKSNTSDDSGGNDSRRGSLIGRRGSLDIQRERANSLR